MLEKITNCSNEIIWIDLFSPTEDEAKAVESEYGIHVPSRSEIEEIETSSRLQSSEDVISVNVPNVVSMSTEDMPAPVGFILTPKILITLRYLKLQSFEGAKQDIKNKKNGCGSSEAFVHIIEQMVDTGADELEKMGTSTTTLSRKIFQNYIIDRQRNVALIHRCLRLTLVSLGNSGGKLSQIREIQLGLQRIIPFVLEKGESWMSPTVKTSLNTIIQDLESLTDFETHLSDRIQFLLDAILGFINTEQNDIFKVLTIVTVVGIPPTFIASWYGMNFHFLPEYSWILGYPFVISLTLLSIVLPIIWFKWRGWW